MRTPASIVAEKAVLVSINEKFGHLSPANGIWASVIVFNDDQNTTYEMVEEATKLALIKLETGWAPYPEVTSQLRSLRW